MLVNHTSVRIMLHRQPVDMRKSIDGLSLIVSSDIVSDPGDGRVYVFYNKGLDKIKMLYWEINGFCMLYKRLEKGRYKLPPIHSDVLELDSQQLRWLMDGLDITKVRGFKHLKYKQYY